MEKVKKPTAKIAIVTRTRNRNLLLERAIRSVEEQTFEDYIHVIVNDGGASDDVAALVKKYDNVRRIVLHNKSSVGLTKALNQGIQAVDSEYIAILDDDDSLHCDRLKSTVDFLDTDRSQGVAHIMDRVIEEIDDSEVRELSRNRWLEGVDSINLYKQCADNYLTNGAFTYRRSAYEELNGYDETLLAAEDWDFGIRFLLRYDIDFLHTAHALSYYHHRPSQKGDSGNSVFAGVNHHKYTLNKLHNKYLRDDINTGKLGIGYIMNSLSYRRELEINRELEDLQKVVRIEGHINYKVDSLEEQLKLSINDSSLYKSIKDKIHKRK